MLMESFNLSGQNGIVTGASRGIGKAVAFILAEAGVNLSLISRDESCLKKNCEKIEEMGRNAIYIKTDVGNKKEVEAAVSRSLQELSRIDILVNCAGINIRGTVEDFTEEDYEKIMCTNLKGTFLFSQAVGKHMIENKRGKIMSLTQQGIKTATKTIAEINNIAKKLILMLKARR